MTMNQQNCDICNGPKIYGVMPTLIESDIWRVELNPTQKHLGRVFVGLRRHKATLGELTASEVLEHHRIVIKLERALKATFKPDLINWLCLMNNAVRDGQETHVHWHMIPRYKHTVTFEGRQYVDDAMPGQYNAGTRLSGRATMGEINAISNLIRRNL